MAAIVLALALLAPHALLVRLVPRACAPVAIGSADLRESLFTACYRQLRALAFVLKVWQYVPITRVDNGTLVVRRGRKAKGLTQIA